MTDDWRRHQGQHAQRKKQALQCANRIACRLCGRFNWIMPRQLTIQGGGHTCIQGIPKRLKTDVYTHKAICFSTHHSQIDRHEKDTKKRCPDLPDQICNDIVMKFRHRIRFEYYFVLRKYPSGATVIRILDSISRSISKLSFSFRNS